MSAVQPEDWLNIAEIAKGFLDSSFGAAELLSARLDRIGALDPTLGAWLHVDSAGVRAAARARDLEGWTPRHSPLWGVPIGVKDQIVTEGLPTTAGSRMLEGWRPPYDATVIARLRAAGALVVGKLAQDEFAMGVSGETCAFGPTKNPWDLSCVPGGSSSGAAAAVASGMVPIALGTDTGGSVRQPAAFCGIVGLRPTYGRVSRYGVIAHASSMDQVGVLARTVHGAAVALEAISGHDPLDSASLPVPPAVLRPALPQGVMGLRVGVVAELFGPGTDPGVRAAIRDAISVLESLGAEIVELSIPALAHAASAYRLIAAAEAFSNLARYDGVRFGPGPRADSGLSWRDGMAKRRGEGFGREVKRRLLMGAHILASDADVPHLRRAQTVRTLIRNQLLSALGRCTMLLGPTAPTTAFPLGALLNDPVALAEYDRCVAPASLAGLPALSVPCGFDSGLPVGLQLIGPPMGESKIIQAAAAFEGATVHHWARPTGLFLGAS